MARRADPTTPSLATAVQAAVDALTLDPTDTGAAQLALRYAQTIDDAAQIAAELDELPDDEDLSRRVDALAAKVDAQTVLDTLGPKLLAALDALGATPKARNAHAKGGTAGAPTASPLDELRARRAARAAG